MIKEKVEKSTIEIDLTGPQGNAHYLLGVAVKLCKQLDLNPKSITDEMMMGDYELLIDVFDSYFGDYVILYR